MSAKASPVRAGFPDVLRNFNEYRDPKTKYDDVNVANKALVDDPLIFAGFSENANLKVRFYIDSLVGTANEASFMFYQIGTERLVNRISASTNLNGVKGYQYKLPVGVTRVESNESNEVLVSRIQHLPLDLDNNTLNQLKTDSKKIKDTLMYEFSHYGGELTENHSTFMMALNSSGNANYIRESMNVFSKILEDKTGNLKFLAPILINAAKLGNFKFGTFFV